VRRFVGADEVEGYDVGAMRAKVRGRVMMLRERILGRGKEKKV